MCRPSDGEGDTLGGTARPRRRRTPALRALYLSVTCWQASMHGAAAHEACVGGMKRAPGGGPTPHGRAPGGGPPPPPPPWPSPPPVRATLGATLGAQRAALAPRRAPCEARGARSPPPARRSADFGMYAPRRRARHLSTRPQTRLSAPIGGKAAQRPARAQPRLKVARMQLAQMQSRQVRVERVLWRLGAPGRRVGAPPRAQWSTRTAPRAAGRPPAAPAPSGGFVPARIAQLARSRGPGPAAGGAGRGHTRAAAPPPARRAGGRRRRPPRRAAPCPTLPRAR
jgi:hypothetical protein